LPEFPFIPENATTNEGIRLFFRVIFRSGKTVPKLIVSNIGAFSKRKLPIWGLIKLDLENIG
jgi:hypothetical protein